MEPFSNLINRLKGVFNRGDSRMHADSMEHNIDFQKFFLELVDKDEAEDILNDLLKLPEPFLLPSTTTEVKVYGDLSLAEKAAVIVPGYDRDGEGQKYDDLIRYLLSRGIAVARINNKNPEGFVSEGSYEDFFQNYFEMMNERLNSVNNAVQQMRQVQKPSTYFVGSSSGAGSILALSYLLSPMPNGVLALGPSEDIGPDNIIQGLENYPGKVVICFGQYDDMRFAKTGKRLELLADENRITFQVIPGAYHPLHEGGSVQIAIHNAFDIASD